MPWQSTFTPRLPSSRETTRFMELFWAIISGSHQEELSQQLYALALLAASMHNTTLTFF